MLANSQRNPAWKNIRLGTCNDTIGQSGCYITALGILVDKTPPEVNQILKDGGGYSQGCLVNAQKAADLLGLEYNGITKEYQNEVCIAETDHYKSSGVPQHFFVWLGRGSRIIDTLTGIEQENPYHIVSFRLFKPKGVNMECFASREMVVSKAKEFVIYFREKLLALPPLTDQDYQKMAEFIADDNLGWTNFLKDQVKGQFFAVFMRKSDCKSSICPPCDCTEELNKFKSDVKKMFE